MEVYILLGYFHLAAFSHSPVRKKRNRTSEESSIPGVGSDNITGTIDGI
jgi:hypothetical protein